MTEEELEQIIAEETETHPRKSCTFRNAVQVCIEMCPDNVYECKGSFLLSSNFEEVILQSRSGTINPTGNQ